MARPMPLALQYICTNGWCVVFASALRDHPCAAGSVPVDLLRRQTAADVARGAGEWEEVHTLLRLLDGRLLDVEGARTEAEILVSWGIPAQDGRFVPADLGEPTPGDPDAAALRDIADALGWTANDLPDGRDGCASDDWEAARDAFCILTRDGRIPPAAALAELIEDARSPLPGLARLRRALAAHEADPDALFFEDRRTGSGRGRWGLRYRDVDLVTIRGEDAWTVDLHVEGVPPETGSDPDPYGAAVERFEILAREALHHLAPHDEADVAAPAPAR